ncbi:reverse transcriptase [Chryseobacterium chendengshani]|uniref:reverse transcriptase domain-containing protein n=1 Tax=Chryseobacterium sp. LJ668 TaxID=2864040 RepID=UPI001C68F9A0|nr:reverse transcriptase domain-containing protein [Chryseobacterium sp. LJ668]MBW8523650.1 reverse transcriptase [Chryseobacterium sp. LJ668]QYK15932.1 reverse transcriptase [Chryseobacterium sp. LJ668]
MKNILEVSSHEAKIFFLKKESYSRLELPHYFNFQLIINKIDEKLINSDLKDFRSSSPREFENVNYKLITNKDGKYAWRPFQLIHPAIYVNLVNRITDEGNWKFIIDRFKIFRNNKNIECHSLPLISITIDKDDKRGQILSWWQLIEQRSLHLSLEYKYTVHTDITDCYGSIYTHSIPWALHTKEEAKKRVNRNSGSIGNIIDNHLQDMSYGQTNGIPQGSALMDFIAEILLGYVDLLLSEKLKSLKIEEYKILRYRDDYRIFTNNSLLAEEISKYLAEILSGLGLKINAEKTQSSNDLIKSAIKSDKKYWILNKRIAGNKQKWLLQLYFLSENYPNSGTIDTEMREFLKVLQKSKRTDYDVITLVSLTTQIAIKNPRVVPTAIAILSIFLSKIKDGSDKKIIIKNIKKSFTSIPNSSLIMIWFQRLYLTIGKTITFEELLCKKVINKNVEIWNSEWLDGSLKKIIDHTEIVDYRKVIKSKEKLLKIELKFITRNSNDY